MTVAIEIPDDIERQLKASWSDLPRRVLEAVALEAYRSEALTAAQIGRLLGLASRWEVESFLNSAAASLHYDDADLERDGEALHDEHGR